MGLVGHFEVEEAAKVLERISRSDSRDHFIPNEKFRLELKRWRGEFLYTKFHPFINPDDEFSPMIRSGETV